MAANHWLIVQDSQGQRQVKLDAPLYSIGRDAKCDIRLVTPLVARHHATLVQMQTPTGEVYYQLVDGDASGRPSANGFLINGQRVPVQALKHADEIVFGPEARATYYVVTPPEKDSPSDSHAGEPRSPNPLGTADIPDAGNSLIP